MNVRKKISCDPALAKIVVTIVYLVLVTLMGLGILIFVTKSYLWGSVWFILFAILSGWVSSSQTIRDCQKAKTVFITDRELDISGKYKIDLERIVSIEPFIEFRGLSSFKITLRSDHHILGKTIVFLQKDVVIQKKYRTKDIFIRKLMELVQARKDFLEEERDNREI